MNMTKIVINSCYGGFGLSDEAIRMFLNRKNIVFEEKPNGWGGNSFNEPGQEESSLFDTVQYMKRSDPDLVYVVETLGEKASGRFAKLEIEELPVGTLYRISEYDGLESLETRDETEWSVA